MRGLALARPLHVRSVLSTVAIWPVCNRHYNCRHMNHFFTKHHHQCLFPPKLSAVSPSLFCLKLSTFPNECVWPRNMTRLCTTGTTPTTTTTYLQERIPPSLFPSSSQTLRSTWVQINAKSRVSLLPRPPFCLKSSTSPPQPQPPPPVCRTACRLHQDAPRGRICLTTHKLTHHY